MFFQVRNYTFELIRNDNAREQQITRPGSKTREICSENSINTPDRTKKRQNELEDNGRNGWKDLFGG